MWVLAEHSMASNTDDIGCHYAKATLLLSDTEKASTWGTAVSRVSMYVHSVDKGKKEPRSPNSVTTLGDRWGFHRWCLYPGLGKHPSAQTWLPIS